MSAQSGGGAGNVLGQILNASLPNLFTGILGGILGRGSRNTQNQAAQGQLQLAQQLANIFQQQAAQELPFRANVQQALSQRAGQTMPMLLPQLPRTFNPLALRQQMQVPQSGPLPQGGAPVQRQDQNPLNAAMLQLLTQGRGNR